LCRPSLIYENKFKNHEKKEDKKLLDDFLAEPLKKINNYSSGSGFEKDIANLYEKTKKEYKSYVKKIPMLIKTNGLGATFAFMLSKGGTYEVIGEQVLSWLEIDEKRFLNDDDINSFKDLNKKIICSKSPEYRALTIEVLAFFNWLKRFADGLIEGEAENE
jgi:CRISPR-associated protein Cmr5